MTGTRIERVVVTGGRQFTDCDRIEADLRALMAHGLQRVAEGHSPGGGADDLAHHAWYLLTRSSTERYRPRSDLDGVGVSRFPRRNIRMLETESRLAKEASEMLIVSGYPDPDSRGTWHCVKQAIHRGIPVACWMGPEYALLGDAIWRRHSDKPNVQVMTFGRADVVDFDCVMGDHSRLIVVPSKGRGDDEALDLGRAIRDALAAA